jgi:hypothetical protein
VWTLVSVAVAGAVAGATVGGLEARAQPQAGSLGLIDGRR